MGKLRCRNCQNYNNGFCDRHDDVVRAHYPVDKEGICIFSDDGEGPCMPPDRGIVLTATVDLETKMLWIDGKEIGPLICEIGSLLCGDDIAGG